MRRNTATPIVALRLRLTALRVLEKQTEDKIETRRVLAVSFVPLTGKHSTDTAYRDDNFFRENLLHAALSRLLNQLSSPTYETQLLRKITCLLTELFNA